MECDQACLSSYNTTCSDTHLTYYVARLAPGLIICVHWRYDWYIFFLVLLNQGGMHTHNTSRMQNIWQMSAVAVIGGYLPQFA